MRRLDIEVACCGATAALAELRICLSYRHLLIHEGTRRIHLAVVTFSCVRTTAYHGLELVRTARLKLRQAGALNHIRILLIFEHGLASIAGRQVGAAEMSRLFVKAVVIFNTRLLGIDDHCLGRQLLQLRQVSLMVRLAHARVPLRQKVIMLAGLRRLR